jgi:hypothetical protein
MPWAWGLAWTVARGAGTKRDAVRLAAVLALQVLPGYFQLAFLTQISVILIGLGTLGERIVGRLDSTRGLARLALAHLAVGPLAAMQLGPTLRLARLAADLRDCEYLSGFAATPLHLVSYVAPGLFQRSPLWRPLAWDPFHTSPEEHLAYVGLVPLFLALGAIGTGLRRDAATRALTLLAAATLVLSLGPYVPGFTDWCRLPGSSFFRAPARWTLATELALALLAGQGFDRLRTWSRPGRMLAWFSLNAALAPLLVVLGVELALASSERPGWPTVANGFEGALRALPWEGDPDFRTLMSVARRPQNDPRVYSALARQGRPSATPAERTFARARVSIYVQELGETSVLLSALLILSLFARRRRFLAAALLALTALDLLAVGRHRAIDLGPIRPLVEQSRVLARLAALPRGTPTADPIRSLPMIVGAAPLGAYRSSTSLLSVP